MAHLEMVIKSLLLEKFWSFNKARNVLIKKNIYSTRDFAKYLSFKEVVKNSKVVNV